MDRRLKLAIITIYLLRIQVNAEQPTDQAEPNEENVLLRMDRLEKKFNELKSQQQILTHYLNRTEPGPNDVHFTANLNDAVKGLVKGQKIVYDYTFSEAGGGYDKSTGIFTAPTSGVYFFSMFCNSLTGQTVTLELVRDGNYAGSCVVEPSYDGELEIGGITYASRLNIGDKMWVEIFYSERGTVELAKHLNTFTGVLIHR